MTQNEIEQLAKNQYRTEIANEISKLFEEKEPIPHLIFLYKQGRRGAELKMIGNTSFKFQLVCMVLNEMVTKNYEEKFDPKKLEVLLETVASEVEKFGTVKLPDVTFNKKK